MPFVFRGVDFLLNQHGLQQLNHADPHESLVFLAPGSDPITTRSNGTMHEFLGLGDMYIDISTYIYMYIFIFTKNAYIYMYEP